jgi:hypothetical protein
MNYLVHATPVHPSLCLQYLILLFTIDTVTVFILLLMLLFHYCYHYKTVATDKLLRASLFPGAAELATHLLRLINILCLPLCRINKFRFYFPRRLLWSPIHVGHHLPQVIGLLLREGGSRRRRWAFMAFEYPSWGFTPLQRWLALPKESEHRDTSSSPRASVISIRVPLLMFYLYDSLRAWSTLHTII